jgi:hypothetical protein
LLRFLSIFDDDLVGVVVYAAFAVSFADFSRLIIVGVVAVFKTWASHAVTSMLVNVKTPFSMVIKPFFASAFTVWIFTFR